MSTASLCSRDRCDLATDFRKQILDKLEKLGKSKYWLSQQLGDTPSVNALYTYLREGSETDMKGAHIAKILDVLEREEKRQQK